MQRYVLWQESRTPDAAGSAYTLQLLCDAEVGEGGFLIRIALLLHADGIYADGAGSVTVAPVDVPLDLPAEVGGLLHDELFAPEADGLRRFRSWQEIQELVAAKSEAQRREILKRGEDFRKRFASYQTTTTALLGLGQLGEAQTACKIEIELPGLLAPTARRPERPLLRMSVTGQLTGSVLNVPLELVATVSIEVGLDAEHKLACSLLTGLQRLIDAAPVLKLPRIPLPQLNLAGLGDSLQAFGQRVLAEFRPLALPLPGFDAVAWHWDIPLTVTATLTPAGALKIETNTSRGRLIVDGKTYVTVDNFQFRFDSTAGTGAAHLNGTLSAGTTVALANRSVDPAMTGPVTVQLADMQAAITADPTGMLTLRQTLGRVEIRAKEDPEVVLAFHAVLVATIEPNGGAPTYAIESLNLIEPYPIALIDPAVDVAGQAAQALLRFVQEIHFDPPGSPAIPPVGLDALLDRLRRLVAAVVKWVARQAGAAGEALAGLARNVADIIADLMASLRNIEAAPLRGIAVELRFERSSLSLRQLILSPILPAGYKEFSNKFAAAGFTLDISGKLMPALVFDFRDSWAALVVVPQLASDRITLGTDLWLARQETVEAASGTNLQGQREKPLIQLEVTMKKAGDKHPALVLLGICDGKPQFLSKLGREAGTADVDAQNVKVDEWGVRLGFGEFSRFGAWSDTDFACKVSIDKTKLHLLPFLKKAGPPASDAPPFGLDQYVEVTNIIGTAANGNVSLDLSVAIRIDSMKADAVLKAVLDLKTMQVSLEGGERIEIEGTSAPHSLLGMDLIFAKKGNEAPAGAEAPFKQLVLDFSNGDMLLALHPEAIAMLRYTKMSSRGKGIEFRATTFGISRDGLDLSGAISPVEPVILAGVDTPFNFTDGSLEIKHSAVQHFTLKGSGQLPSALIGDATAKVALSFGPDSGGRLKVLAASGDIDRSADPIVAHAMRFRFTLSQIGFSFKGDDHPHFYFLLTGSAEFQPAPGEFQAGLLQHLSKTRIKLDRVPLTSDASVLMRYIEFQVPIEPPVSCTLFDVFSFELRGIGFHPASPAFDGDPALSISGKVAFMAFGDIPTVEIDIDQLWISYPAPGTALPRVRMDNLAVGINLGMGRIKASAIAVDDTLPTLYKPATLPSTMTANGFVASGAMSISGLPDLSAAMAFLELRNRRPDGTLDAPRHAFFIYAQLNRLSQPVPTPIGEIYLREAGFGFGFRYTLEGIAEADRVTTPQQLIQVLDQVSRHANDLADPAVWWPEASGDRLTLALRLLFTLTTASEPGTYDASREQPPAGQPQPANPVMFDAVAALRSDGTFLMTVRAWLCVNYADWLDDASKQWRKQPGLRGYMYLSVPRKQFLARFIGDPAGHIGEHPPWPKPLRDALKALRWSSTLYVDESVFHFELGWPYELGYTIGKPEEDFHLVCEGGLVTRFADGAYLNGLAFRAVGLARFKGRAGGGSLGASIEGVARFGLEGKMISYLSARDSGASMLYGALRIDVTIDFQVLTWVEFEICRKCFRREQGFALQLTVAVAAEVVLAAHDPLLGVRIMVTVGVSVFGCSLRVGVGLALNGGLVDQARARVERLMTLGLAARYPDPEAGMPSAVPAQPPRGEEVRRGDRAIEQAARDQTAVQPRAPDAAPDAPAPGAPIGATRYWAILFPTRRANDDAVWYVMQLIPCDLRARAGLPATGDKADQAAIATFFAAPDLTDLAGSQNGYTLGVDAAAAPELLRFSSAGGALMGPTSVAFREPLPKWNKPIAADDGGSALLAEVLGSAFLPSATSGPAARLTQPGIGSGVIGASDAARQRAAIDPAALDAALARAARDRASMNGARAAAAAVEERRSGLIATIGDSAAQLAAAGETAAGWRATDDIDARDLGLTFLVNEASLEQLRRKTVPGLPDSLKLIVNACDAGAQWTSPNVSLFNPPENMFHRRPPSLRMRPPLTTGKITLDWDLEPTWGDSGTVYNDPEFHLKHYLIWRRVTGALEEVRPWRTTSKTSMPMVLDDDASLGWRFERPPYQFIDELGDLGEETRYALLGQPASARDAQRRRGYWDKSFRGPVQLVYTIVAVDNAGNHSDAMVVEIPFDTPQVREGALRRASLKFDYSGLPSFARPPLAPPSELAAPGQAPALWLVLEDADHEHGAAQRSNTAGKPAQPESNRRKSVQLLLVREGIVPAGVFGIDALTEALHRPLAPAADAPLRRGEALVELVPDKAPSVVNVVWRAPAPTAGDDFADDVPVFYKVESVTPFGGKKVEGRAATAELLRQCGIDSDPNTAAVRVYARCGADAIGPSARLPAEWTTCDLVLEIDRPVNPGDVLRRGPPLVSCAVEAFEHPTDVVFAPLGARDIHTASGRLTLVRPRPDAVLAGLAGNDNCLVSGVDPERRVGVKLSWNARPASLALIGDKLDATGFERLIGGYDVFSVDPGKLPDPAAVTAAYEITAADTAAQKEAKQAVRRDMQRLLERAAAGGHARHVGRVQLQPRRLIGLEPSETGDMSRIEAFYPSATLVNQGADGRSSPADGARRHRYLSLAESMPVWPKRVLRRHLVANPAHDTIDALFAHGTPQMLRLQFVDPSSSGWHTWANTLTLECGGDYDVKRIAAPEGGLCSFEISRPARPQLGVDAVRQLLAALVWKGASIVDGQVDGYAALSLHIAAVPVGHQAGAPVKGMATVPLDLAGPLHPVLADLLDALRFDRADGGALVRRYEPVIDVTAPTTQKTLFGLFDELPPERDPYGWAALRTFGLALALRLFDTLDQRYLAGSELAGKVQAAFAATLASYAEDTGLRGDNLLGAPFVELFVAPETIMHTVLFDAGLPKTSPAATVARELRSLVQLSLRPVASGLHGAGNPLPVRYYSVASAQARGAQDVLCLAAAADGAVGSGYAIDVMELADRQTKRVVGAVMSKRLSALLNETASSIEALALPLPASAAGAPLALIRVVAFGGNGAADPDAVSQLFRFQSDGALPVLTAQTLPDVLSAPQPATVRVDAFECFAPLSAERLALLAYGRDGVIRVDNAAACLGGLTLAARAFAPPQNLDTREQQSALMQRIADWSVRFISHGPAQPVDAWQPHAVGFALATIPRPDPWRALPDRDGSIELLLPQKDRYGKMLWYLVRPFGRYDNLAQAVLPEARGAGNLAFMPRRGVGGDTGGEFDVFAPAVLHRSEPLAAPIVLAARPIADPDQSWEDSPGGVEVILGRHPEQVLANANTTIEGQLAFRETGVGLWREFTGQSWLAALELPLDPARRTDVSEAFGPKPAAGMLVAAPRRPEKFKAMLGHEAKDIDNSLIELDAHHADLWSGARALYLHGLPYGFRTHLLAHASAGVVVSEQVGRSFDFARHVLNLPWLRDWSGAAPAYHGRQASGKPYWSYLERKPATEPVMLEVSVPLVRYIDGMPLPERQRWFDEAEVAARLFAAPDPAVSYRLSVETGTGEVIEHQLELTPGPTGLAPGSALYQMQAIAGLFDVPAAEPLPPDYHGALTASRSSVVLRPNEGGAPASFAMRLRLPLAARERWQAAGELVLAGLPLADADFQPLFALEVASADFDVWRAMAPQGRLDVSWRGGDWTPLQGADCVELIAAAANWHAALSAYPDLPAGLLTTLEQLMALPDMAPGPILGNGSFEGWRAGLPRPDPAGTAIDTSVANPTLASNTLAPADCGRARRSVFERYCWPLRSSAPATWDDIVAPVLAAMAHTALAHYRAVFERGHGGIPRLVHPLAGAEPWARDHAPLVALLDDAPLGLLVLYDCGGWTPGVPGTPARDGFDNLLSLLEQMPDAGAALQTLIGREGVGQSALPASLALLLPLRRPAAITALLATLGCTAQARGIAALVLARPPTDAELNNFDAAAAASDIEAADQLAALLRQLAADQLFGPGRRLRIDCFHGRSVPRHGIISRL